MALPRIYEYTDNDGNVYWSFNRSPTQFVPPTRLVLASRLGVHLINFLGWLRSEGRKREETESVGMVPDDVE